MGRVWIGTATKGLYYFEGKKLIKFRDNSTLNNKRIDSIFVDSENSVWVGTYNSGLFQFFPSKFKSFTQSSGLVGESVYNLFEDGNNELFATTAKGFHRFKNDKFIPEKLPNLKNQHGSTK